MEQFAYSFAITMMHSIWQMALLLLFYYAVTAVFSKWPPIARRNLLLCIVAAQIISSVISFYFIYSAPFLDYRENIQAILQNFNGSQNWLQQYAPLLFSLYAFGLMFKLSKAWFNWKRFNRFYKAALIKPSVDIRLFAEAKALHFGIKRKVQVWCSEHIQTPVTFGFFKPMILLPVALVNQLSLQQTESLVVHELTHIKNSDYLFNWLLLVTDALFFFNPFVKIAVQKIKQEREKTCDVQVLQFNYPAISYAEALLHIARQQQMKPALAIAAVNKKTELLDRIRFFSDDNNLNSRQTKHFSLAALLIWSFIALNIFFAAVFVTTSKPQQADKLQSFFAAAPLNEWNRSFNTKNVETPEEAAIVTEENEAAKEADHLMVLTEAKPQPVNIHTTEEAITTESFPAATPAIMLTPVSYTETTPASVKDIVKDVIIDEEVSGVKITQAYRVTTTVNGEVKMEPLWMISEVKPSDSLTLQLKKDSSVIRIIPAVQ